MIKFDKEDITYTAKQINDNFIITMLDDNQFYLFEIELNKSIQIKCITPLASDKASWKVTIDKNNLLATFLDYLFNNSPTLTDSFHIDRYLKIAKDYNDNFILEMSKESCINDDVFYSINIYPKKDDTSKLIDQINILYHILEKENDLNSNNKTYSSITKTLYRKAV